MSGFDGIRLELSARVPEIRFLVSQAISKYQGNLDETVAAAVESALKDIDFDRLVQSEVETEIRSAVKSAVRGAVTSLMWEGEFSGKVKEAMRQALLDAERKDRR